MSDQPILILPKFFVLKRRRADVNKERVYYYFFLKKGYKKFVIKSIDLLRNPALLPIVTGSWSAFSNVSQQFLGLALLTMATQ